MNMKNKLEEKELKNTDQQIITSDEDMIDGYCKIKLSMGRFYNIVFVTSEKYDDEFVQIQHLRSRDSERPSKSFNLNKKNVRILGEGLLAFASANNL